MTYDFFFRFHPTTRQPKSMIRLKSPLLYVYGFFRRTLPHELHSLEHETACPHLRMLTNVSLCCAFGLYYCGSPSSRLSHASHLMRHHLPSCVTRHHTTRYGLKSLDRPIAIHQRHIPLHKTSCILHIAAEFPPSSSLVRSCRPLMLNLNGSLCR